MSRRAYILTDEDFAALDAELARDPEPGRRISMTPEAEQHYREMWRTLNYRVQVWKGRMMRGGPA